MLFYLESSNFNFQMFILKNDRLPPLFWFSKDIQGGNVTKSIFGHNFWNLPKLPKIFFSPKEICFSMNMCFPEICFFPEKYVPSKILTTLHLKCLSRPNSLANIFQVILAYLRSVIKDWYVDQKVWLSTGGCIPIHSKLFSTWRSSAADAASVQMQFA